MGCLTLSYCSDTTLPKVMYGKSVLSGKSVQIWLSVDPLSDKYPSLSPYVYCANNPIKLVDPNGKEITGWPPDGGSEPVAVVIPYKIKYTSSKPSWNFSRNNTSSGKSSSTAESSLAVSHTSTTVTEPPLVNEENVLMKIFSNHSGNKSDGFTIGLKPISLGLIFIAKFVPKLILQTDPIPTTTTVIPPTIN